MFFRRKKNKLEADQTENTAAEDVSATREVENQHTALDQAASDSTNMLEAKMKPQKKSFFSRIKDGLTRTRSQFAEGLGKLLLGKKVIDDELLEDGLTRNSEQEESVRIVIAQSVLVKKRVRAVNSC